MPVITIPDLLAYSCFLPAVAGAINYKRMDKSFHPFIWAMFLSVFTESIVTLRDVNRWPVTIHHLTGNFYYVLNLVLYLLFFYRLKAISLIRLTTLLVACGLAFIANSFIEQPWQKLMFKLGFLYAIIIFFISGKLLSEQIFNTKVPLHKNAQFIICCGILLYVFYCLYFTLRSFKINLSFILTSIMQPANALSYLVFFWGVLWIPKKNIPSNTLTP